MAFCVWFTEILFLLCFIIIIVVQGELPLLSYTLTKLPRSITS